MFRRRLGLPVSIGRVSPETAVLFIHGLGGSYLTWEKFATHLSDNWDKDDAFSFKYDEYYSNEKWYDKIPFISKLIQIISGPSIEELADHLKTVIDEVCREYVNIIIIAHSMGGLVSRKYLIERIKSQKELGKVKGLITYATPHHGSRHANVFKMSLHFLFRFMLFQKSEQIINLAKRSDFLLNLNREWTNYRIEDKIDFTRVVGLSDWIVNSKSSSFIDDNNVKKVANKGHFSIIVPNKSNSDPAFLVTYNYLREFNKKLEERNTMDEDLD